jgi:S-adenosyl-L-methionine hydrolase (adenosine-forming)
MKNVHRIITLTTDFGSSDWFVGAMKGVIWSIHANAQIADISHEIPPGQVAAGAFVLANACGCFPEGTIHVAVVDPGVGSRRAALIAHTSRGFFIGPDNGLLSLVLNKDPPKQIRRLENPRFFRHPVSATFHGRDIFAPAAAHLAAGTPLAAFGPRVQQYHQIWTPEPPANQKLIQGEVCYIDRFGNAITSIPESWIKPSVSELRLQVKRRLIPLRNHYQAVAVGQPVALVGSHQFIEIAVNGGSAVKILGLGLGTPVKIKTGL